jgi:hypothetical protein
MSIATFPSSCDFLSGETPFAAEMDERPATECPEVLCVWESREMPGLIQLGRLSEPPETAEWTLQSMTGQSRFRVTYYVAAANLAVVEEQVRAALAEDEIKQQEGFYYTPRRFAIRAIEEITGKSGRTVNLGFRRARKAGCWAMAASLLLPLFGAIFFHATHKEAPAQKPAFHVGAARLAVNLPR